MTLAANYALATDVDIQPLDLSIRPKREQSWPLQFDMMDQCEGWLTTKCICNIASSGSKHLASCVHLTNTSRHRPHAGLLSTLLSNADFTFYTQRQVPSSNSGFRSSHHRQSPYHLPPRRTSDTAQEDSAIQQTSYKDHEDMCSSSDCVTCWQRHSDQDIYSQSHTKSSMDSSRPNHAGNGHHTGTIFHSGATAPLVVRPHGCQSGNSPSIYSHWETSEISSPCQDSAENVRLTGCALYKTQQQEAACRDTILDTLETQSRVRPATTHKYRDKTHQRAVYTARHSPDSQQTSLVSKHEQLCHPESHDIVSSSSHDKWDLYSDNSLTPFSTWMPDCVSQHNSQVLEQPGIYKNPEMDTQQPLSYSEAPPLDHPTRISSSTKDNSPWKNCSTYRPTSITPIGCDQVSTSTDSVGTTDSRPQRPRKSTEANPLRRSPSDNFTSTQVNILDFWVSKFLWERSVETASARKPCHFEYICSDNGQKKIRFRLVDLMELQVEQSLLA